MNIHHCINFHHGHCMYCAVTFTTLFALRRSTSFLSLHLRRRNPSNYTPRVHYTLYIIFLLSLQPPLTRFRTVRGGWVPPRFTACVLLNVVFLNKSSYPPLKVVHSVVEIEKTFPGCQGNHLCSSVGIALRDAIVQ